MSIEYISSNHKAGLKVGPSNSGYAQERFYLDTRQAEFPNDLADGTVLYKKIVKGDNCLGTYNAMFFQAISGLEADSEDFTGMILSDMTVSLADFEVLGHRLNYLLATADSAYAAEAITFTGDGKKGIHIIARLGTVGNDFYLRIYDNDDSAYVLDITIHNDLSITETVGEVYFKNLIDDNTIELFITTGDVTAAHDNVLYFDFGLIGDDFYLTALRVTDFPHPAPYYSDDTAASVARYYYELPSKFTVRLKVKPYFNYDTSANHIFFYACGDYADNNNYFAIYYSAVDDTIKAVYRRSATTYLLSSSAFTSIAAFNKWLTIDCSVDLTTGTTAGSSLYIDCALADNTWDSAISAPVIYSNEVLIGGLLNTEYADAEYEYVHIINTNVNLALACPNGYDTIYNERVVWDFNGHATGKTEFKLPKSLVRGYALDTNCYNPVTGEPGAQRILIDFYNLNGSFSDDQYDDFEPQAYSYNGTTTQRYLRNNFRIIAESYYSGTAERFFIGKLDSGLLKRTLEQKGIGIASGTFDDLVCEYGQNSSKTGRYYEDTYLASGGADGTGLFEIFAGLAGNRGIKNYAGDTWFGDTVSKSFTATTPANLTKAAGGYNKKYYLQYVYNAGLGGNQIFVQQDITFTGNVKLNVGETYIFQVMLECADNFSGVLTLDSRTALASVGSNTATVTHTGQGGYKSYSVAFTITNQTATRLRCSLTSSTNTTLKIHGFALFNKKEFTNYYPENATAGASAVCSADNYAVVNRRFIGYDGDKISILHPWARIEIDQNYWAVLKQLALAVGATYLGMTPDGVLKLKARLKDYYSDPESMETITNPSGLSVGTSPEKYNRVIISGDKITKLTRLYSLFSTVDMDIQDTEARGLNVPIASGAYWPDGTIYPRFFARYSNV